MNLTLVLVLQERWVSSVYWKYNIVCYLQESSRTPSVAELGCADPDQPCRLPNSFQADPPLDQGKK